MECTNGLIFDANVRTNHSAKWAQDTALRRDLKHHSATILAVLAGAAESGCTVNISFAVKDHSAVNLIVSEGMQHVHCPLAFAIRDQFIHAAHIAAVSRRGPPQIALRIEDNACINP